MADVPRCLALVFLLIFHYHVDISSSSFISCAIMGSVPNALCVMGMNPEVADTGWLSRKLK